MSEEEDESFSSSEEIEVGEADMTIAEVCRFLIFSVLFVFIILNQIDTESAYHINAGITQALTACDPSSVASSADVVDWIRNTFLPTISNNQVYLDWTSQDDPGNKDFRLNIMNRIITPMRFVQKRMTTVANANVRTRNLIPTKWVMDTLNAYIDNGANEDKRSFKPQHFSITSASDVSNYYMYEFQNNIGIHNSGGFMYVINITNTQEITAALTFFENTRWVDNKTAIIYVDFVSYNSHYSMLSYVNYLFTFSSSGLVTGQLTVMSSHFDDYTAASTARIILEGLYLLMLVFYSLIQFQQIKVDVSSERIRLTSKGMSPKWVRVSMVLYGLKKHFGYFWNLLDGTSTILSYVGVVIWIIKSNNAIVRASVLQYSTTITDQVFEINTLNSLYIRVNSVNILIIFFRLMKYLGIFERIRLLHQTFVRAKNEIFYFFILLVGIFLSFVIFGHVAFGGIHERFSDVGVSFASCLVIVFYNMDTIQELLILDFNMTAVFIVLFTLFINFILANMFIAIINNSYRIELAILEHQKLNQKVTDIRHWIYKTIDWFKQLWLKILSICSKKKAVVNKYTNRAEEIEKLDEEDEVIRAKNFNLDYNEAMLWGGRFDKEILTDKQKQEKISKQTSDFSKSVWKALVFIIFAIIYTVVLLSQMEIQTKYNLNQTVQTQIKGATTSGGISIGAVGTYSDFTAWLGEAFQEIFGLTNAYELQGNYLLGQAFGQELCPTNGSLRLTARYVKTDKNPISMFYPVNNIHRERDFQPTPGLQLVTGTEDTHANFGNNTCPVKYTGYGKGGFALEGGYVFYFSNVPGNYSTQMMNLLSTSYFLNESTNSIVIDFVLYNGDLNYFTYAAYIAQTISGGEIFSTYYIWPMKLKNYFTAADKIRALFEVIFLLLLFHQIYGTVRVLRNKFKNYDDWSSRFSEILTTKQKEKRRLAKPEILRKIMGVVTASEILDIVSYLLSLACVIYWLVYISSSVATSLTLPVTQANFHDLFSEQANILQTYLNLSSFNILLIYFRIMNYVTINKALRFLQDTMRIAMVDILYFLVMLMIILIGFVFMAYLSFGHTLAHYKTIQEAFITCFAMMVGEFDYPELSKTDNIMGNLFFFIFMITFVFILLNIFIAILERAYTKVKRSTADEPQNVTVFESLLIFLKSVIKKAMNKSPHEHEHLKDVKELAICVFNRIEAGIDEDEDPVSWATRQSEEILLERQKRMEIKAPLDAIFRMRKQRVIEGTIKSSDKPEEIYMEFEARIDYWDYLRYGFLKFQSQEQKIRLKTEELIKKNQTTFEDFKEVESEKDLIINEIHPLEKQLMKIKKENEELRERLKKLES